MKKTFYASCIVAYNAEKQGENYNASAEIKDAELFIKGLAKVDRRQQQRANNDIKALTDFIARINSGEKIGICARQYIGHKYVPDKVNNKWPIIYIGDYCYW